MHYNFAKLTTSITLTHISITLCIICISFLSGCSYFSRPTHIGGNEQQITSPLPIVEPSLTGNEGATITICKTAQRYIQHDLPTGSELCVPVGHGVIINNSGYILTAKHIVEDLSRIYIATYDTGKYPIQSLWTHPTYDLALGRIDATTSHATMNPGVFGKDIYTIDKKTVSTKILTGQVLHSSGTIVSSTLNVNPGHSGSPLFNDTHHLIGIIVAFDTNKKTTESLWLDGMNIYSRLETYLDSSQ